MGLAIGMWPRGEVGVSVLVLSISYGIGGPIVTAAMLSLALNLVLTGAFILVVKRLIDGVPDASEAAVMGGGQSQPGPGPAGCMTDAAARSPDRW